MMGALVFLALLLAGAGFLFSSQATVGVYLASMACLLGIFARLAQAHWQHKELVELARRRPAAEGAPVMSPAKIKRDPVNVLLVVAIVVVIIVVGAIISRRIAAGGNPAADLPAETAK